MTDYITSSSDPKVEAEKRDLRRQLGAIRQQYEIQAMEEARPLLARLVELAKQDDVVTLIDHAGDGIAIELGPRIGDLGNHKPHVPR